MRQLISVNTGLPREVVWRGKTVLTSIWKSPVPGRVHVAPHNLDGDQQSDLTVHGGANKAVYVYPSEHYAYWQGELPEMDLGWGTFGENFTTTGLLETEVSVGDCLCVGSAEFMVTQPRMPCFKLGLRFGRPTMEKRFLKSRRSGFYLAVLRAGDVATGDAIEFSPQPEPSLTITELVGLYAGDLDDPALLRRAAALPALPLGWRNYFLRRLAEAG
jgi:MOSC domain-containing protein YiiM